MSGDTQWPEGAAMPEAAIREVEEAVQALHALVPEAGADVEAHRYYSSDENLKQVIERLEDALSQLRELEPAAEEDAEVEAHRGYISDENLKQAIKKVEHAIETLKNLEGPSR